MAIGDGFSTNGHRTLRPCWLVLQTFIFSALLTACGAGALARVATASRAALEDCHADGFASTLQAAPAAERIESRAYWLTRQLIKWPAVDTVGSFKLYHSAVAQMTVATGQKLAHADGALSLEIVKGELPAAVAMPFKFVAQGVVLTVKARDLTSLPTLLKTQLILVQEDAAGRVRHATALQMAGALDDWYQRAAESTDLGVSVSAKDTQFKLWAPTARRVAACIYRAGSGQAQAIANMHWNPATGIWSARLTGDLTGLYYSYLVDVFVSGVGVVRNRVTDPYAISLTTDSRRSYIADLSAATLKPSEWDSTPTPVKVLAQTDMVVYELHVRDFSMSDDSVSVAHRGKYLAFTEAGSRGMRHLKALSDAGLTDVHLLPVFDFASVPEAGCQTPNIADPIGAPDSEAPQAAVVAIAASDCFNWGYDPYHFNAPEGSYATDPADGATRIVEFRQMVMALHRTGLRVGMDVVYNHTSASGQKENSVFDRIVPGYYHRLDATGAVERSTCCDNTATENLMMGKLMVDSAALWAKHYRIDSFRFDLMGHQPRATMEALQRRVDQASGHHVNLIGEGWNFGEVANGARFVQASQLSLNGSGIGTFSDRGRDALRGGHAGDAGEALIRNQGYLNGLVYDRNALAATDTGVLTLMQTADQVRVGLAGSIRDYPLMTCQDLNTQLSDMDYNGQNAGYVSQPAEVVNYVENHDNQTLFDINVYKLPVTTSREDRVRAQMLGVAITAFSQGVAYFHAGVENLRSKSMDGNSYDSGDWFNRLDWTFGDNYFATGVPPQGDNGNNYPLIKPLLRNAAIKPNAADIAWARDLFFDLLKIRSSTTLLRLRSANDIKSRLKFYNIGSTQNPTLLVAHLDGSHYPGAGFKEIIYFVNVDKAAHNLALSAERGKPYVLHPVHMAREAADKQVAAQARYDAGTGRFTVPARTALVYVVE